MSLQTWVARFVVDSGRVTEEGPRLRSFQRRRLDEPDADLYVLAEPAGTHAEELVAQALDAIGRLFLQDRLSLTGGLLRALRSTHQTLLDWNRRSVSREQVSAGVSAVVVSGNVAYLAQAGPSLAYLESGGVMERLAPDDDAASALGEGATEPGLRRIELAAGDVLLVAAPALESLIGPEVLEGLLGGGGDTALPELYLLTRDQPQFALFAITCFEGEASAAEPAEEEGSGVVLPAPVAPRREPTRETGPAAPGPPAPVDISRSVVRLRSEQGFGRNDYARTTGPVGGLSLRFVQPRLLAMAGLVAAVLLVVAFTLPGLVQEQREAKVETLIAEAQGQIAAVAEADPATKRRLLEDTRRLVTEVLRVERDNPTALQLRDEAGNQLSALNAVLDLGPMRTLVSLGQQLTGAVSLSGVTTAGGVAYLLDAAGGRIVAVPLRSQAPPVVLFEEGQTYGGTPAKKPQLMAWEGPESAGRLLVLDTERKLFEVRAGALPAPLPLRKPGLWASAGGLAAYDGNLYVLDARGSQVYRYLPAAAGFDSEPVGILSGAPNLRNALGLAVDGDVYVYEKHGRVLRFRNGSDAGFGLGGIDRPPRTPTSLVVLAAPQEVLIADSGNKRIVVAGKDGVFRRQLVSNAFTDLRAIAVDAADGQLYAIAGDSLLTAPLVR